MKLSTLLSAILLLVLGGCASLQGKPAPEQVKLRVTEQMNAFLAQDYDKAFTYMTPGYQDNRKIYGFGADFAGLLDLVAFEVIKTDCQDERCVVSVKRTQKLPAIAAAGNTDEENFTFNVTTKQTWIKIKGRWYHYKRS